LKIATTHDRKHKGPNARQRRIPGSVPEKVNMDNVGPLLADDLAKPFDGGKGDPNTLEVKPGQDPWVDFNRGVESAPSIRVDWIERDEM
jgi:hypothetical protein